MSPTLRRSPRRPSSLSPQARTSYTSSLRAIAQDDVAPFVPGGSASFTDSYPLTSATVPWTPEAASSGVSVATPELRTLVQEVIDRPGWAVGNHLGLVFPEIRSKQKLRCFNDESVGVSTAALVRLAITPMASRSVWTPQEAWIRCACPASRRRAAQRPLREAASNSCSGGWEP